MSLSSVSIFFCLLANCGAGFAGGDQRGQYGAMIGLLIGTVFGTLCGGFLFTLERTAGRNQGMKAVIPYSLVTLAAMVAPLATTALSFYVARKIAQGLA